MRSYWGIIQRKPSAEIQKTILETHWLQKNNKGKPCKREISYDKPNAFEKRLKNFK